MFYSKSTGGFYSVDMHKNFFVEHVSTDPSNGEVLDRWFVPDQSGPIADAVEISAEHYAVLINGQVTGKIISGDENGHPVLVCPAPPTLDQLSASVRAERDRKIADIAWRYERIARQVRLGITPTDNISALDAYVQALADITLQATFPQSVEWPEVPA